MFERIMFCLNSKDSNGKPKGPSVLFLIAIGVFFVYSIFSPCGCESDAEHILECLTGY